MNNVTEGFILGSTPYREHDAMIHFLSDDYGLMRLVLPGYYKPTSKQGSLGLEYTRVRYRLNYQEGRLNRILNGELINAYMHKRSDFTWLMNMSLVSEIIIKTYDDTLNTFYCESLADIYEADAMDIPMTKLVTTLIRYLGFEPNVQSCVVCGSTQINTFSIEKGGFLCPQHSPAYVKDTKETLLALRRLFVEGDYDAYYASIEMRPVLEKCVRYLGYHGDYTWHSLKLMNEI